VASLEQNPARGRIWPLLLCGCALAVVVWLSAVTTAAASWNQSNLTGSSLNAGDDCFPNEVPAYVASEPTTEIGKIDRLRRQEYANCKLARWWQIQINSNLNSVVDYLGAIQNKDGGGTPIGGIAAVLYNSSADIPDGSNPVEPATAAGQTSGGWDGGDTEETLMFLGGLMAALIATFPLTRAFIV